MRNGRGWRADLHVVPDVVRLEGAEQQVGRLDQVLLLLVAVPAAGALSGEPPAERRGRRTAARRLVVLVQRPANTSG